MFVRGGIDALLLRTQLTIPDNKFLGKPLYEIFQYARRNHDYFGYAILSLVYGIVVPLQIGHVMLPSCNE